MSDGQHSACHSVGLSSLESRGTENGTVEGRRAREGGRPSEGLPTAGRAWGREGSQAVPHLSEGVGVRTSLCPARENQGRLRHAPFHFRRI